MANYKETDKDQGLFLAVNLAEQILPGTFEWTMSYFIDNKVDFSGACYLSPLDPNDAEKFTEWLNEMKPLLKNQNHFFRLKNQSIPPATAAMSPTMTR
jgi:hypothetical protein